MSETIEQTWEQEVFAEGETRGRLTEARENLRWLLERRFGTIPERRGVVVLCRVDA